MRLERLEINGFKSFSDRRSWRSTRGHRDRRTERLRQEQRRRRHHLGDGRAEREEPARRQDGRRHLQRQRRAQADRAAEVRLRFSGVMKTVTGPAFRRARRRRTATVTRTATDGHGAHGNGHGNGNGHAIGGTAIDDGRRRTVAARRPSSAEELIQSVAREVEVTRRLYRSGESEYLIDGQVCRLRDIHDLLMDTGPWRQGLRDHRAGQDRDDSQLAADRSAPADRRGRRRHQIQGAAPRRPS